MKITKFPQSCILVETKGVKILVDPSEKKFDEKFLPYWSDADAVLVTHKHSDHINNEVLETIGLPIFSTSEVAEYNPNLKIDIIAVGDVFTVGDVRVEVVNAIHGYVLPAGEIKENVGFILDNGDIRLYITSDTIRFKNDYKADVLFANVTAFDASMNLWGATATMKEVGAKLLVVAHQDVGKMFYGKDVIMQYLNENHINYIIPEILETFEI